MTGQDDEFEDFLRRKRPIFRAPGDPLEPPADLDRLILRQAREAIDQPKPHRVFRAPGWGVPVAIAATLVLALTVVLHTGVSPQQAASEVTVRNVARSVETAPVAAAPAPPAEAATAQSNYRADPAGAGTRTDVYVADIAAPSSAEAESRSRAIANEVAEVRAAAQRAGDRAFVAREEASRHAEPPPAGIDPEAAADAAAVASMASKSRSGAIGAEVPANAQLAAGSPPRKAPALADFRRDSKSWLAEIERLRQAGDLDRADAELTEFKRQHRAYATSPDR
jgi:hypothetical protein